MASRLLALSRSRQVGRAGGWSRVLGLINLKRIMAAIGKPHASPVGRVCHRCQVSKSAECQFEFCQIDSRNLSGVSDSLILAQWPFCRRIAATAEGSEESGKRGFHAWSAGAPGSHGPPWLKWATEGLLAPWAFWSPQGLWEHGRAISRHCGTSVRDVECPGYWFSTVGSCGRDDEVTCSWVWFGPGLAWLGLA